jgi:hydrogenase maturation protease
MTRVLVGGVGYRWMGDASFGLAVIDALARESWPADVEIADLGYGALYVALDLADHARPPSVGTRPPAAGTRSLDRLVLVAGVERGREPGQLSCVLWRPIALNDEDVQARIREAGAGVIDLDHLLVIAQHFGSLPSEVFCIELEPVDAHGGERLSEIAARQVSEACALVRSLARGVGSRQSGVEVLGARC